MEPSPRITPGDQAGTPVLSAYLWEPFGRGVSIYIDFDVVDRLGYDVMRGFSAVPRRGAEVGGLLLGTAESGERLVVHVEDYVPVPCEHLHGPSYILSDKDLAVLDETLRRWTPSPDRRICLVGFYRSNTREAFRPAPEDLALLDSRLPDGQMICLLIKPYATRPAEAAYYFRQNGKFVSAGPEGVFPFRRRELGGGKPARRIQAGGEEATDLTQDAELAAAKPEVEAGPPADRAPAEADQVRGRPTARRRGWFWIPLSFLFLLLGIALGFQIALSFANRKTAATAADPYSLELTVIQFGERLHLRWNPEAAAFRGASRGLLEIRDGDNIKTIELSRDDLGRGGVLYRNSAALVRFRLEVQRGESNSVVERQEVQVAASPAPPAEAQSPSEVKAPEAQAASAPGPDAAKAPAAHKSRPRRKGRPR